jgi:hypothetical protein
MFFAIISCGRGTETDGKSSAKNAEGFHLARTKKRPDSRPLRWISFCGRIACRLDKGARARFYAQSRA